MTFMWACESCSKTFSRKGDLTRHKHLHTGYKPYVCRDCGKSFAQFSGLKTHRNVHTKVKPFVCELDGCTAVFGDPSSCTRHRKERHQTIGAYRCPVSICKSSIKRRSAFRLHLRKHGIDPDTVDIAALAPTLLPRQTFQRQKPQPSSPVHKAFDATPNILYSNNNHAYIVSKLFQISLTRMPHRIIFLTPAPTPWMAVCQSNAARCNHRGCRPSLLIVENIQSTQRHLLLIWISPCPHHQPLPIMTLSARLSNLAVHLVQTI
ncbi:hypothetical protein L208DRAFT_169856 [Tricholoma matsutake]|nr:hypothetical protein L208DRAFT_169856 [Tricholoma matsutake 945]